MSALAGEANLSWTAPTENMDGTLLTDLAGYKVYHAQTNGIWPPPDDLPDPEATTYRVIGLAEGAWFFTVKAYDYSGNESPFSNVATKTIDEEPRPPSGLHVIESDMSAYSVVKSTGLVSTMHVGTVPAGTECNTTFDVNGRHGVPTELVTWASGVDYSEIKVTVADCE